MSVQDTECREQGCQGQDVGKKRDYASFELKACVVRVVRVPAWASFWERVFQPYYSWLFEKIPRISYHTLLHSLLLQTKYRITVYCYERNELLLVWNKRLTIWHESNFDVRIRQSSQIHFLQILSFKDTNCQLARGRYISQREANVTQFFLLTKEKKTRMKMLLLLL